MEIAQGPELFESIANHPDVFPAVSCKGCGRIRFGQAWAGCVGLQFGDRGGFVYVAMAEPDVWEVHTLFLPGTRGTSGFAQQSLRHMFEIAGAARIVTMVPADLPHVRRFALRQGFMPTHTAPAGWERESGPVDLDHFELSKEAWQCQQQQSSA